MHAGMRLRLHLPACLRSCLPAYLPACLHACACTVELCMLACHAHPEVGQAVLALHVLHPEPDLAVRILLVLKVMVVVVVVWCATVRGGGCGTYT